MPLFWIIGHEPTEIDINIRDPSELYNGIKFRGLAVVNNGEFIRSSWKPCVTEPTPATRARFEMLRDVFTINCDGHSFKTFAIAADDLPLNCSSLCKRR